MARIFQTIFVSKTVAKNMKFIVASVKQEDLLVILELMRAGKVRSIVDKRFPLSETAEAFRYFKEGRTRGKIVITVG
jgi:NADPH:quinone reductase-like Zn-dependent oxidoreductase